MTEIWKDIEGFEGLYQVSNLGSVKSLNYRKRGYAKLLTPKYKKRKNLRVNQYTQDGVLIRTWDNSRQVFLENGWSDWSISECCRNKRKKAYGFIWQYAN